MAYFERRRWIDLSLSVCTSRSTWFKMRGRRELHHVAVRVYSYLHRCVGHPPLQTVKPCLASRHKTYGMFIHMRASTAHSIKEEGIALWSARSSAMYGSVPFRLIED